MIATPLGSERVPELAGWEAIPSMVDMRAPLPGGDPVAGAGVYAWAESLVAIAVAASSRSRRPTARRMLVNGIRISRKASIETVKPAQIKAIDTSMHVSHCVEVVAVDLQS